MIKVRVEVVTSVGWHESTWEKPVDDVVTKFGGEDYCGEYAGQEYVSSYFIPWDKVDKFMDKVKKLGDDIHVVHALPYVVIDEYPEITINLTDNGMCLSDYTKQKELVIEVD